MKKMKIKEIEKQRSELIKRVIKRLKNSIKKQKDLLEKLKQEDSPARITGMLENIIIDIEDLIEDLSIANDKEIRELICDKRK